jgi:hypothetical protein
MAGGRRVRPLSSGFGGGFSLELLVHRAAQGMRTQCTDQRNLGCFVEIQSGCDALWVPATPSTEARVIRYSWMRP